MRYWAYKPKTIGQRINLITNILPPFSAEKKRRCSRRVFHDIFLPIIFQKKRFHQDGKREFFLNWSFKGKHFNKNWGMNIYWISLLEKVKILIQLKGKMRARVFMGINEISFGHLNRSGPINLWKVFIGSISIKLSVRIFGSLLLLGQERSACLPKKEDSFLFSTHYHGRRVGE